MSVRTLWWTWVVVVLVWLAGSAVLMTSSSSPINLNIGSRGGSVLNSEGCAGVLDAYASSACRGVAGISRRRQDNEDASAAYGQLVAGAIIVGPAIFSLFVVWLVSHSMSKKVEARALEQRRAQRAKTQQGKAKPGSRGPGPQRRGKAAAPRVAKGEPALAMRRR